MSELVLRGVIHGNRIELTSAPGISDGAQVEVVLRCVRPPRSPGDGLRRTEGALADDAEWDGAMEQVHAARRRDRRPRRGGQ